MVAEWMTVSGDWTRPSDVAEADWMTLRDVNDANHKPLSD